MAHDPHLAELMREAMADRPGITEKKMFGGLCFTHHGNMLCGCDLKNGLSVRVGPDQYEKVLKLKHTRPMTLTGRPLKGLVFVHPDGYKTKASLAKWIERGLLFTKTLPRK